MLLLDYKRAIVDHINQANGTDYKVEDAKFGIPYDAVQIPGANPAVSNSVVRVRFGTAEYTYAYNRVTLAESLRDHQYNSRSLLRLQSVTNDPRATVAASITAHYGYPMDPEDIIGNSIVLYETTLVFETSVRSLRYRKEKISLRLDGTYVRHLGDFYRAIEPTRVEPEWWYEDRVDWVKVLDTAPQAAILTYGNDYSPIANTLMRFSAVPVWSATVGLSHLQRMTELAFALRSVDNLPWVIATTAQVVGEKLNLLACHCPYNGPTKKFLAANGVYSRVPTEQLRVMDYVNPEFTHVMLLRPNSNSSLTADKSIAPAAMILHYNLPGAK